MLESGVGEWEGCDAAWPRGIGRAVVRDVAVRQERRDVRVRGKQREGESDGGPGVAGSRRRAGRAGAGEAIEGASSTDDALERARFGLLVAATLRRSGMWEPTRLGAASFFSGPLLFGVSAPPNLGRTLHAPFTQPQSNR